MLLSVVHLQPSFTLPPAILLAIWLAWYWLRLGRPDVPRGRRIIRRASIAATWLAIVPFVRALSYVDPVLSDEAKREYIITWTVCGTLLLIIVAIALIDLLYSFRAQRAAREEIVPSAARGLVEARRAQAGGTAAGSSARNDPS
jgi:hypothetical protein